jgi:dihydroorotase
MLLIKNGRVLNPATKTDAAMDVLLDGDRIKEVGAGKNIGGRRTIAKWIGSF